MSEHPAERPLRTIDAMRPDLATASAAMLILAVARWQEDALAEIYRRHAGAIYGLAQRVLWSAVLAC